MVKIKIKKISKNLSEDYIPSYATPGAAGVDLYADLNEAINLMPGENRKVPTGIAIELPSPEIVALVFGRSGLAANYGISLTNGVGVIDSDFRGEIQILLINKGKEAFMVKPGMRIAQMVFMPVLRAEFEIVNTLGVTERGTGGFGSTGI